MNVAREEFKRVKMDISEAEMNLLGDDDGNIPQKKVILARSALESALRSMDDIAHKHRFMAKPPKADL